jgi:predicted glycogen debranching enzyme
MKLPSIVMGSQAFADFDECLRKEWLVTNGLGGYSSSTVFGVNTRKYHGLLVAAFRPPGLRRICLSKLDEEAGVGSDSFPLGANEFRGVVFPQGYRFLRAFSVSVFPRWVYDVQNVGVEKTVFMPYEKNVAIALYKVVNKNDADVKVSVFPILNWRHFHDVTDRWRNPFQFVQKQQDREVKLNFENPQSVMAIRTTDGSFNPDGKWIERFYYREEAARGESCYDDCYEPGRFEVTVKAQSNEDFAVVAAVGRNEDETSCVLEEMPATAYDADVLLEKQIKVKEELVTKFLSVHSPISPENWLLSAVLATDTFVAEGIEESQRSVIAGYHWFEAWGRDTFVSLPGLMLVTGRFGDARRVFVTFSGYCKNGLIPNVLADAQGQAGYNSVDASLWFVNSVLQYLKYTGDFGFVKDRLWASLKSIIDAFSAGTLSDIRVDSDGLLGHGGQLTWMDAVVDGQAITPRAGKAVEVQALWYNALKTCELLARNFKEDGYGDVCRKMAEVARKSFVEKFWNVERNCLFDVLGWLDRDGSLRPNQIVAVGLDFALLDAERSESVIDVVQHEFLTPYGLRTLSRNDGRYCGSYEGDRRNRDRAYHNGSVWPWLLGPFVTAYLKVKGKSDFRREFALKNFLFPLFGEQFFRAGLGSVSEIFDGEPPHKPKGCIAQAWSVAEPLRAYVEDVLQKRPSFEGQVLRSLG